MTEYDLIIEEYLSIFEYDRIYHCYFFNAVQYLVLAWSMTKERKQCKECGICIYSGKGC